MNVTYLIVEVDCEIGPSNRLHTPTRRRTAGLSLQDSTAYSDAQSCPAWLADSANAGPASLSPAKAEFGVGVNISEMVWHSGTQHVDPTRHQISIM